MTGNEGRATLGEFESLLDGFGADPERWPADRRARALALLAADEVARRRHAEARALDQLLDRHAKPDARRLAGLAERIVAEAQTGRRRGDTSAGPPPAAGSARIIRLDERRPPSPPIAAPAGRAAASRWPWRTAAALAASLVIGVAIGLTDLAPTSEFGLTTVADASSSDTEVVLSALQSDRLSVIDEEQI